MNRSAAARLRLALVMLAWLAQAFMPLAHAFAMGAPKDGHGVWCGDASDAQASLAVLPPELRAALDDPAADAERLAGCALLCAAGTAPPLVAQLSPAEVLRAAGLEPVLAVRTAPPVRPQAPTPPAQAPPLHS